MDRRVVFFDGVCALCNRSVRFLMARDRHGVLYYAPLQGETFRALTETIQVSDGLDSIVYVRGYGTQTPALFVRSEAFVQIMYDLGGVKRMVSWCRIVPRFIRDAVYDWIARHRYRWFGRYDECRVPDDGGRDRLMP